MKLIPAVLLLAMLSGMALQAEDAKPATAPAEKEDSWKGLLGNSQVGALATLHAKGEDKAKTTNYSLVVDPKAANAAELTKKVQDLLKSKANVQVTGVLAPDGTTVKVKEITEAPNEKKTAKKKDKADKPKKV